MPGPRARLVVSASSSTAPPFTDVPWPSDAYRAGGRVVAPSALDRVFPQGSSSLAHAMGKMDGFSRFAPAFFWIDDTSLPPGDDGLPAPATIDPASLPANEKECTSSASAAFLVDLEAGALVPCRAEVHDDRRFGSLTKPVVAVGPARGIVLAPGHRYAAVLTTRVRDASGKPIAAAPDLLRLQSGSRSGALDSLYGGALDTVMHVAGASLAADGAQVAAIAPFTTSAMHRELFEAREVLDSLPVPTLHWDAASLAPMGAARFGDGPGFTATLDAWLGVVDPAAKLPDATDDPDGLLPVRAHDRIAAAGTAVYASTSFLVQKPGGYSDPDHASFAYDAHGVPTPAPGAPTQRVWLTLFIPKAPMPASGYPVVIYQHGAGESRAVSLLVANTFCARGWIVAAIDSITFGARAPEAQFQVDQHTDYESAPGATYRGPDGIADAAVNGGRNSAADLFGDLSDIGAMRDQMRQAALDTAELVRVLRSSPDLSPLAPPGGPVPRIDGARIAYVGSSMGSIEGTSAAAIVPEVRAWVFNVSGGGVIQEAAPNGPDVGQFIGAAGILFGLHRDFMTESHPLIGMFQWLTEAGDPLTYASTVVRDPQPHGGAPTRPRDLVQIEVLYDTFAADESGEALARALGIPMAVPNVGSNAGIRDVRHPESSPQRVAFPQAQPDATGAIHDAPVAGTTAVLVQTSPGHHGWDFTQSRAKQTWRIPYALYDTGVPFRALAPSKVFTVRCAYRSLQAMATRFIGDAFDGRVPSVAGFQPPVRDYDDDGTPDATDPDPSDPTIR